LLNIPAFRALKEAFPQAKIILAVSPGVEELARCIRFVDEVITWENRKHRFFEIIAFSREIRKNKFSACVILNPSKEFNIIAFYSGIPVRVGYDRKWGFLLTHKIKDNKRLGQKHEVEYNLELVSLLGAKTQDKGLSLALPAGKIDLPSVALETGDFIAIHPWTSDPLKQWPAHKFLILAQRLAKELGKKIIFIGGRAEFEKSRELFRSLDDSFVDLTGKTNLIQLALILHKCKLLISADSGPVHLASCVGTASVVLFRNDLPGKTALRWGPWDKKSIILEKNNLMDISVEEVFNKVKEIL